MWIGEPGKITDRIDFLGTHKNCLYLLKGREAMLIGGGMSWTAPALEKQFSAMDYDFHKIKYLVIPHSHFDHCGAVPYLKRKFPWLQVVASAYFPEPQTTAYFNLSLKSLWIDSALSFTLLFFFKITGSDS